MATPCLGVDKLGGHLYATEPNSMTLVPEKATIMPQAPGKCY